MVGWIRRNLEKYLYHSRYSYAIYDNFVYNLMKRKNLLSVIRNRLQGGDERRLGNFGQGERLLIGSDDTRYCTIGEF